jgi:hypothetical protein
MRNRRRYRRLGDIHPLGGKGDASGFAGGDKVFELPQGKSHKPQPTPRRAVEQDEAISMPNVAPSG